MKADNLTVINEMCLDRQTYAQLDRIEKKLDALLYDDDVEEEEEEGGEEDGEEDREYSQPEKYP